MIRTYRQTDDDQSTDSIFIVLWRLQSLHFFGKLLCNTMVHHRGLPTARIFIAPPSGWYLIRVEHYTVNYTGIGQNKSK